MDSPQKKIGSTMDGEMPLLLPVSETVSKETLAACPDTVLVVSSWAFLPPFVFVVCYALDYTITSALSLFSLLTEAEAEAEAAELSALDIGMLCCAALQAAAAVLAMLLMQLPCRHVWVRYAFAYLALAFTIVGHCMFAAEAGLSLFADPGDLFFSITCTVGIFLFAVGDICCFLALLLFGDE